MYLYCILSGVILLSGCTTISGGIDKTSNVSESTWYESDNSANHATSNNSYKAVNDTQVTHGSKNSSHTNKKTKAVEQKEYDAAIDNLSKLPEYILIRI
ncbi:hypothetical protein [Legionella waltersii]|uniref:Uncharacterized protein n=1 Tax=Legionella waltersii TaxID=66969 RepID=A0A0W1ANT6_9GAMM|nr:hypothetical protein [Legionella waltersii]KTD82965.1 hypothetical protein Lwal_0184 [Legionella waltersii]SNU97278.1 Uncharacterised protein [Legionella waltersii]